MSLAKAIMKQKQINTKQSTNKLSKKVTKQVTKFNEGVLSRGGESVLTIKTTDGKKREIAISVHSYLISYTPQYKYHYRNCFGNRVFIKVSKQNIAQEVCDHLEGKGKYSVSGCVIG